MSASWKRAWPALHMTIASSKRSATATGLSATSCRQSSRLYADRGGGRFSTGERKGRMTQPTDTRELVRTIAQQLGETQPGPINQIRRVVQRLGPEAALAFLQETQQIEAQGGRLLPAGSRRRTPGGVFFTLIKDRVSAKDRVAIFFSPGQRQPRPAQP